MPDLGPHVVSPVEDVSRVPAEGAAAEDEAVRPLAAPAPPGHQQSLRPAVISREPDVGHVTRVTLVQLHPARPVTCLLRCRSSHPSIIKIIVKIQVCISLPPAGLTRLPALWTGWAIHPAEELGLEPLLEFQQKHVLEQGLLQTLVFGLGSVKLLPSRSLQSFQRDHR